MRRILSMVLVAALALPGCATTRSLQSRGASATPGPHAADPKVMADYIRQLPIGSRIRLSRSNGDEIRGTLMKNDADPVVVQRRARIPEAPIAVPIAEVVAVELDVANGSVGRSIAIGAGAAAAAVLGVFLVLAAIYSD